MNGPVPRRREACSRGTASDYVPEMLRGRFYDLIDAARSGDDASASADPERLASVLEGLDDEELSGFVVAFDDELIRLNRWDLWGAGYVANGGMSDDAFHYFRSWLIGKGSAAVEAVLEDPDSLAEFLGGDEELENEELEYVGLSHLEDRDLPDPRDAGDREQNADDEPAGTPFDEDTVDEAYPRIAAAAD